MNFEGEKESGGYVGLGRPGIGGGAPLFGRLEGMEGPVAAGGGGADREGFGGGALDAAAGVP